MVPDHEIIGVISAIGSEVTRFKPGDTVGVGCLVESCRTCDNCSAGLQQYCTGGMVLTYSAYERDGKTVTYGGYSNQSLCSITDRCRLAATANGAQASRAKGINTAIPTAPHNPPVRYPPYLVQQM